MTRRAVGPAPHGAELAPFLGGAPRPVELVSRLLSVDVSGATVTMRCATDRHEPLLADYYGTVAETVFGRPTGGRDATVVVDFWHDDVARVRYAPGAEVPATPVPPLVGGPDATSPMVVGTRDPAVTVTVVETADAITASTSAVTLTVVRDPWRLELRDRSGALLWATKPVDIDGLARPRNQWNPPEQRWIFLHRYAYPLGCTADSNSPTVFASFDLRHDERVVGFGESFGRLDKVGTRQTLWTQEAFGNASPASYKPVPFHLSSRGHGLFVHTSNAVRYEVGSLEHTALSVVVDDTDALDLFVLAGSPTEVLGRYAALTGPPALPPRWSFGFWLGRISYSSQEEVQRVAREVREHAIPCDVIHVDTGWFAKDYTCDLTFAPDRFPDPAAMTKTLAADGFRVCLWQWPNYNVASPLFDEAVHAGHLAKRPSGHAYTFAGGYGEDAGVVDFSNPEAVEWYRSKLAALFAMGIAAIKADYGDGAPPAARYAGVDAPAMRNLYPLLYQDAVWSATQAAYPGEAVIWARAGWAGAQRYPVHWSGDGVARFEDLACVVRSMLSIGLSGFPFYSHDVGGFSGTSVRTARRRASRGRTAGRPRRSPGATSSCATGCCRTSGPSRSSPYAPAHRSSGRCCSTHPRTRSRGASTTSTCSAATCWWPPCWSWARPRGGSTCRAVSGTTSGPTRCTREGGSSRPTRLSTCCRSSCDPGPCCPWGPPSST
jgi:alpha-D-xyloside xylohydrolase